MRWATGHKKLDDMLGSGCEVRELGSQGGWLSSLFGGCAGGGQTGLLEDAGETESPESGSHLTENFATGKLALVKGGEGLPVGSLVFLEFHLGQAGPMLAQGPPYGGKSQFLYMIKLYALVRREGKAENIT